MNKSKPNKNKHIDTENWVVVTRGARGEEEREVGKGGQMYDDG